MGHCPGKKKEESKSCPARKCPALTDAFNAHDAHKGLDKKHGHGHGHGNDNKKECCGNAKSNHDKTPKSKACKCK